MNTILVATRAAFASLPDALIIRVTDVANPFARGRLCVTKVCASVFASVTGAKVTERHHQTESTS